MPTSALATMWLLNMLQLRRPDLHVRDPYRSGIEQFERRPRRPGELPDDRSFDEIVRRPWDQDEDAAPPATQSTTVRSQRLEGGTHSA